MVKIQIILLFYLADKAVPNILEFSCTFKKKIFYRKKKIKKNLKHRDIYEETINMSEILDYQATAE